MKLAAVAVVIVAIAFGLLMVVFRDGFSHFTSFEVPASNIAIARKSAPSKEATAAAAQGAAGKGRLRPWMNRPKATPVSQAGPSPTVVSADAALYQQLLEEQQRLDEWSASLAEREAALLNATGEQQELFDQQTALFDEQQQFVEEQQEDLQWTQAEVDAAWQEQQLSEEQLLAEREQILADQEQILVEQEQLLEEQALLDEHAGYVAGGGGVVYLPGHGEGVAEQPSPPPAAGSSERPEYQNGTTMPAPIARVAPPISRLATPVRRAAAPIPRTANPAVRTLPSPVRGPIPIPRSEAPGTRSLPPASQRAK